MLKTTLQEKVDNHGLFRLDEIAFDFEGLDNEVFMFEYVGAGNAYARVEGNAYIDSEGTTEKTATGSLFSFRLYGSGRLFLSFKAVRYFSTFPAAKLTYIPFASNFQKFPSIERLRTLIGLKAETGRNDYSWFVTQNLTNAIFGATFSGSLASFEDCANLSELNVGNNNVPSDITLLGKNINLTTLVCNTSSVYGAIEDLVQAMRDNGRNSGTLSVRYEYSGVTYQGQTTTSTTPVVINFAE